MSTTLLSSRPVSTLSARPKSHIPTVPTLPRAPFSGPSFRNQAVVVDGLNIIRLAGTFKPEFTTFLSVLHAISAEAADIRCIFDANAWHCLQEYRPHEAQA